MDLLWADFNEELSWVSCEWKEEDLKGKGSSAGFRCDQGLGVPKRTGSLLPHRKPRLVAILKVLKNLFLIQKNDSAKRASIYKI